MKGKREKGTDAARNVNREEKTEREKGKKNGKKCNFVYIYIYIMCWM